MSDLIGGLNPSQKQAVETLSGPLCVLAGAGSGKTKTLTHRIANLLKHGVKPANILAVTFTNKAAGEMRERLWGLVADPVNFEDPNAPAPRSFMPYMGTFHSICVKILREEHEAVGIPRAFNIYDTNDQNTLVHQIMKKLDISTQTIKSKHIQNLISSFKNAGETPDELDVNTWGSTKQAARVYKEYEKAKAEAGALDFDDLLIKVRDLFQDRKDIREKWRNRFEHILIDEYQDTNKTQYQLIRYLVNDARNICVVGDDWQSIYSWRGADFTNILNFEKDFPGATVVRLEENYRSTGHILAAAEKLINHNVERTDKRIFTNLGDGAPVVVKCLRDNDAEVNFVCAKILEFISSGTSDNYSDFAILYRTNAQSSFFEHALMRMKIPYKIVGGLRFYDRAEVKDILSLLQFYTNRKDFVALSRITSRVLTGAGEATLANIIQYLSNGGSIHDLALREAIRNKRAQNAIANLCFWLETADKLTTPAEIAKSAIDQFDLLARAAEDSDEKNDKVGNLKALVDNAEGYTDVADFLADAALLSSSDDVVSENCVTLMTLHAAKGLEYNVVFLTGMEENLFPSARAIENGGLEEERRLAYVGMTRARRHLYLTYVNRRKTFGGYQPTTLSRFLMDIDYDPEDPMSYSDYELETGEFQCQSYDPFPPDLPVFE